MQIQNNIHSKKRKYNIYVAGLLVMLLLISKNNFSQASAFITTWKTDNPGTSNNTSITIPTTGGGYNYDVDWNNDGTYDQLGITGNVTHNFGATGTYTIRIKGTFPRIYFSNGGDCEKITNISQWGTIAWSNMYTAFAGCANLTYSAIDAPDLSGVTNCELMFSNCYAFNGNLNSWDVSTITNMNQMFYLCVAFNGNVTGWNVGNVTSMAGMFNQASIFNQNISGWDVSSVTNMEGAFQYASSFNQNISGWDVSNVTNFSAMFSGASSFNQNIGGWTVSAATNMSQMFNSATSFNQNISGWNVSNVTTMYGMFLGATSFNQNIGGWNVSNVTTMEAMFFQATNFNQNISGWDVSNVTNFGTMFYQATNFNQNISGWDVSSATNMGAMFYQATNFNQNLGGWDISNVVYVSNFTFGLTHMLSYSGLSVTNYDNTIIGWYNLALNFPLYNSSYRAVQNNIYLGAIDLEYCNAMNERQWLIVYRNWTFNGDAVEVGCTETLPIELLDFSAILNANKKVNLDWTTASEINNDYFTIEKSKDGIEFIELNRIKGNGTTSVKNEYHTIDDEPFSGISYYRLKQTDFDGQFSYSQIVPINNNQPNGELIFNAFPNPVSANSTITISIDNAENKNIYIALMDVLGKEIYSKNIISSENENHYSINIPSLSHGIYFIQVYNKDKVLSKKIVVN